MSDEKLTPYQRVGGATGVAQMTDAFYARVLADPELAPFFENSSMDKLRAMQREIFAAALDGPVVYSGRPLSHAHHGRGITSNHFSRFAGHLIDTLDELDLDRDEVQEVVARLKMYHDEVVGGVGGEAG